MDNPLRTDPELTTALIAWADERAKATLVGLKAVNAANPAEDLSDFLHQKVKFALIATVQNVDEIASKLSIAKQARA